MTNPISDLAGIDPDFTGGRLPEDFLADRTGELDALRAENERLKDALKDLGDWSRREIELLRAENERLRANLEFQTHLAKVNQEDLTASQRREERLRAALAEIIDLDLEGEASLADAMHIADEALNP